MQIFSILAMLIQIYSFICFIRILLSWLPRLNYSKIGVTLSAICDPYLNFFKRFRFLSFNGLDFSPAVALCILYAAATIIGNLSARQTLTVGYFLAITLNLIWSLASSIINFITVLIILRLIVFAYMRYKAKNGSYSSYSRLWDEIDRFISPYIYRISGLFFKRMISFSNAMIVTIIASILGVLIFGRIVLLICNILLHLPF